MKYVAIKFCGGCNPVFDRLRYWEEIQAAAGDSIIWVGPDHPEREILLMICGCHTSCPLKNLSPEDEARLILVNDERTVPEIAAEKLQKCREGSPHPASLSRCAS
jgi:hypothetical protein